MVEVVDLMTTHHDHFDQYHHGDGESMYDVMKEYIESCHNFRDLTDEEDVLRLDSHGSSASETDYYIFLDLSQWVQVSSNIYDLRHQWLGEKMDVQYH